MSEAVFDASAVLAVLNRERGHDVASAGLFGCAMSTVNYSEVLKKVVEAGGDLAVAESHLARQNIELFSFDEADSIKAAEIWPECKPLGLSLGDRACIALGLRLDLPLVTADGNMKKVNLPIEVELIRGDK